MVTPSSGAPASSVIVPWKTASSICAATGAAQAIRTSAPAQASRRARVVASSHQNLRRRPNCIWRGNCAAVGTMNTPDVRVPVGAT